MRNICLKFIRDLFLMAGLFYSAIALLFVFCIVLPEIKGLIVHKDDRLILETVYKLATNSAIVAAIAGGVLVLSIVGFWFDVKKWWKEQSGTNPRLARRRLAVNIVIVTLMAVGAVICFVIGKNGW